MDKYDKAQLTILSSVYHGGARGWCADFLSPETHAGEPRCSERIRQRGSAWAGRRRGRVKMLEHRRREEGGKGFLGPGCQEWQLARIRVWKEEEVDERWRAS